MTVYISTGGARERTALSLAWDLIRSGWSGGIELSGGAYDPRCEVEFDQLLSSGLPVMTHNYFPPPATPFVLNLSDPEPKAFEMAENLILQALQMSSRASAKYLGLHAGFLFTPNVAELGKRINSSSGLGRHDATEVMCERLNSLADTADDFGITLLLENHVLSSQNLSSVGKNFLLMVDPQEILAILTRFNGRIGLLLDVGHLKVSAQTLNFDFEHALTELAPRAKGLHLSHNFGYADEHLPILDSEPWHSLLPQNLDFYTLEAHTSDIQELITSAQFISAIFETDT